MENLAIQDPNALGPSNSLPPPGGPPQLPPQMFTTAAQLLDLTDKKLVLVLRDGRKLIGVLRSWDQFANLVLQDTYERTFVEDMYSDVSRGIYLVRGENVLLLGEIDLDKDDYVPEPYRKATPEEVYALTKKKQRETRRVDKLRQAKLQELGFEGEHSGEERFYATCELLCSDSGSIGCADAEYCEMPLPAKVDVVKLMGEGFEVHGL